MKIVAFSESRESAVSNSDVVSLGDEESVVVGGPAVSRDVEACAVEDEVVC